MSEMPPPGEQIPPAAPDPAAVAESHAASASTAAQAATAAAQAAQDAAQAAIAAAEAAQKAGAAGGGGSADAAAQHTAEQQALAVQTLKEHGPAVKLNADGSVNCKACGHVIAFLPPTFPQAELDAGGAPRTVNHTGCPKAMGSPAGAETINVIDAAEVAEFYADKAAFAKKRGG